MFNRFAKSSLLNGGGKSIWTRIHTVNKHLKELEKHGLIEIVRKDRKVADVKITLKGSEYYLNDSERTTRQNRSATRDYRVELPEDFGTKDTKKESNIRIDGLTPYQRETLDQCGFIPFIS